MNRQAQGPWLSDGRTLDLPNRVVVRIGFDHHDGAPASSYAMDETMRLLREVPALIAAARAGDAQAIQGALSRAGVL